MQALHPHATSRPTRRSALADEFFPAIGVARSSSMARQRVYAGPLGTLTIRIRPEGGHATFIEVETDQTGESRLDRNVKRYFVRLKRLADPARALEAAY